MKLFYDRFFDVGNLYLRSEFFLEGRYKPLENLKKFFRPKNLIVNFFGSIVNFLSLKLVKKFTIGLKKIHDQVFRSEKIFFNFLKAFRPTLQKKFRSQI